MEWFDPVAPPPTTRWPGSQESERSVGRSPSRIVRVFEAALTVQPALQIFQGTYATVSIPVSKETPQPVPEGFEPIT